ncbi:MAG: hypothetical protein QOD92_3921 [Acidimicrobiaceae bacterium]|jgi:hypothetical protein
MPAPSAATDALTLDELRRVVCLVVADFDPQWLDRSAAVEAMEQWSTIAHAADAALAMAAARVAVLGPPPSAGARTAADFVAKTTGTTSAKATEKIKTGNGLRDNDRTRAKAVAGELSGEQTAAITDALTVNPNAEDKLLGVAEQGSLGELRNACARSKAEEQDLADVEKRIHSKRALRRWRDAEGVEHLHAAGTRMTMARIDRALKPIIDKIFKQARTDAVREPLEAYAYDALVTIADESVEPTETETETETETGPSTTAQPAATSKRRRRPAATIQNLTIVRADLSALKRGHLAPGETCDIPGLGPISVEAAREMLGESIVKLVITKGVDVRNVTHLGRGPNVAQKVALLWEQPSCMREGCNRSARLEYNHAYGAEYHKTKHTRVDETEPLCDPDHDLQTYEGWALVEGTGKRPMVPPDDPRHPRNRPPP